LRSSISASVNRGARNKKPTLLEFLGQFLSPPDSPGFPQTFHVTSNKKPRKKPRAWNLARCAASGSATAGTGLATDRHPFGVIPVTELLTAITPEPPPAPATYTVAELARLIQASERHIWRLVDLGVIPGKLRLGRLVRFHKPTVDAWLGNGCPSVRTTRRQP
jgi:excisionase family DNA binding protein